MSTTEPGIDVRRIAGSIGAEVTGVRLAADLPGDVFGTVRHALHEHKVIFFHGQDHLTDAEQAGFARLFGDLTTAHPTVPGAEAEPHVLELDAQAGGGKANAWHTDVTFVDRVPAVSILRAITLPPYGGDTCWANTATAYQSLSPELRTLAESLHALHTNAYDYAAQSGGGVGGSRPRTSGTSARCSCRRSSRPSTRWSACTPRRGADAAARPVRQGDPGRLRRRLAQPVRAVPAARHPAGEHRPLALDPRRRGHLGQPRHPALRHRRLRRPTPPDAPRHRGRRHPGRCRRFPQPGRPGRVDRLRHRLTPSPSSAIGGATQPATTSCFSYSGISSSKRVTRKWVGASHASTRPSPSAPLA